LLNHTIASQEGHSVINGTILIAQLCVDQQSKNYFFTLVYSHRDYAQTTYYWIKYQLE